MISFGSLPLFTFGDTLPTGETRASVIGLAAFQ